MRRVLGIAGFALSALTFGSAVAWATEPHAAPALGLARVAALWLVASAALVSGAVWLYAGYEERRREHGRDRRS